MLSKHSPSKALPTLGRMALAVMLAAFFATSAFAVPTMTLPDYSMPLLTPDSQVTTSWTNVVPNALASYFTFVPYSNADAVALGFPASCGNVALGTPADLASTEDCYTITMKKFTQQLAIPGIFGGGAGLLDEFGVAFGATTKVYGYGSGGQGWTPPGAAAAVTGNAPTPFSDGTYTTSGLWHFPGPTVRGKQGRPIRIQWLNELPNEMPAGFDATVMAGPNAPNNYPYNRVVPHVHGAHVKDDSDGFPEAWFTPGFALTAPGWVSSVYGPQGTYRYPMDQEAGTIWYHDHASGLTHINVNMGLAGFFPITDANEISLITGSILPTGNYELGFALQDRMIDTTGQFAMPDYPVYDIYSMTTSSTGCTLTIDGLPDPATCTMVPFMKAADGHLIPYVAGDPLLANPNNAGAPFPSPSTSLEFMGNMPVVNGVIYGKYDVEPRVYRMRFIGGTDSRTFIMKLVTRGTGTVIPFWQIGSEQGLLNNPVQRTTMDLMPGERLDVLVDFTGIPVGTKVVMQNIGPDTPYGGPDSLLDPLYVPSVDIPEIMEFDVVPLIGVDTIATPSAATVLRPAIVQLVPTPTTPVRNVSLMEIVDMYGRIMPTIDSREFMGAGIPSTENILLNDTEQWDIINTTVDAHPLHLHLVAFQVISRQTFTNFTPPVTDIVNQIFTQPTYSNLGPVLPPDAWEAGWKDTIDCPPGKVTRIKAKFDIAGDKYVWHCHILSHEEHDMMRPMRVVAPVAAATPTALWFANRTINTVSLTKTVTVNNPGTAPLFITSIALGGTDPGQFTQTSTCPTGGASLATGATCTVSVTFTPTLTGAKNAFLAINVTGPAAPVSIALHGRGTALSAPVSKVAPAALSFADQALNTTGGPKPVTVSNTGNAPMFFTSISETGANPSQFSFVTDCPIGGAGLGAGLTCKIKVKFRPTTIGAKSAAVAINIAAPAASWTVPLAGTGIGPVTSVSPASLAFGSQAINTTSVVQKITVSNTGNAAMYINSIGKTGANPSQFAVTTTCPTGGASLAAGASCKVNVLFKPTSIGAKNASVAINIAAPALSSSVPLTGTGL